MKGEYREYHSSESDNVDNLALSHEGAELLTTRSNARTSSPEQQPAALPPLGFAESLADGNPSPHMQHLRPTTYEDLLTMKIRSKLDLEALHQYKKEDAQSEHPAKHSLNLTPAHDLVESRVRVAENDIERQVRATMTPQELDLLDQEKNQYQAGPAQNSDSAARPGQLLAHYLELVHQSVENF